MSDTRDRGIGITIKYGKGYEETWATFSGTNDEIRELITQYFGFESASVADLTTSELVVNATQLAHGKGNVAALLGGTVIPSSSAPANDEAQNATADDVWSQAEQNAPNPLLAQIESCGDVEALKLLWAENQAAFSDAEVEAAYKAKGRALTSA